MLNEEGSVESTRRELTAMLFGAIKQGDEIEYGLNKVLVSLSAGSLLFSMTFISALAPGRHCLGVLFLAWMSFGVSIVCVVIGMRKGHSAASRRAQQASDLLGQLKKHQPPVRPKVEVPRTGTGIWLAN